MEPIPPRVKIELCRVVESLSVGITAIGAYLIWTNMDPFYAVIALPGLAGALFSTVARDGFVKLTAIQEAPEPLAPQDIQRQYDGMGQVLQTLAGTLDILQVRSRDMAESLLSSYQTQASLTDERNYYRQMAGRLDEIHQIAAQGAPSRRDGSLRSIPYPTRFAEPPEPQDLDREHTNVVPAFMTRT